MIQKFEIIKKNRKYFAAKQNGYPCKLLIDSNSETLAPGVHTLDVDNISVKTKYGTDVIYKLTASASEQKDLRVITLKPERFNAILTNECKRLGGRWDQGVWVFSSLIESEVEELDDVFNDKDLVAVELVTQWELSVHHDDGFPEFCGYTLARAQSRDSGATVMPGVSFVKGSPRSGGSVKNWRTVIPADSVIRLHLPRKVFEHYGSQSQHSPFSVSLI